MQDEVVTLVPASVTSSFQSSLRQRFFFRDPPKTALSALITSDIFGAPSVARHVHPTSHLRSLQRYPGARVSGQRATKKGRGHTAASRHHLPERRGLSKNGTGVVSRPPSQYKEVSSHPFSGGQGVPEEQHLSRTQVAPRDAGRTSPFDGPRPFTTELGRETYASETVERGEEQMLDLEDHSRLVSSEPIFPGGRHEVLSIASSLQGDSSATRDPEDGSALSLSAATQAKPSLIAPQKEAPFFGAQDPTAAKHEATTHDTTVRFPSTGQAEPPAEPEQINRGPSLPLPPSQLTREENSPAILFNPTVQIQDRNSARISPETHDAVSSSAVAVPAAGAAANVTASLISTVKSLADEIQAMKDTQQEVLAQNVRQEEQLKDFKKLEKHILYNQPLATAAAAAAANRTSVILEQLVSAGAMPYMALEGRHREERSLRRSSALGTSIVGRRNDLRPSPLTEESADAVLALAEKRLAGVLEQSRVTVDKLNGEIQGIRRDFETLVEHVCRRDRLSSLAVDLDLQQTSGETRVPPVTSPAIGIVDLAVPGVGLEANVSRTHSKSLSKKTPSVFGFQKREGPLDQSSSIQGDSLGSGAKSKGGEVLSGEKIKRDDHANKRASEEVSARTSGTSCTSERSACKTQKGRKVAVPTPDAKEILQGLTSVLQDLSALDVFNPLPSIPGSHRFEAPKQPSAHEDRSEKRNDNITSSNGSTSKAAASTRKSGTRKAPAVSSPGAVPTASTAGRDHPSHTDTTQSRLPVIKQRGKNENRWPLTGPSRIPKPPIKSAKSNGAPIKRLTQTRDQLAGQTDTVPSGLVSRPFIDSSLQRSAGLAVGSYEITSLPSSEGNYQPTRDIALTQSGAPILFSANPLTATGLPVVVPQHTGSYHQTDENQPSPNGLLPLKACNVTGSDPRGAVSGLALHTFSRHRPSYLTIVSPTYTSQQFPACPSKEVLVATEPHKMPSSDRQIAKYTGSLRPSCNIRRDGGSVAAASAGEGGCRRCPWHGQSRHQTAEGRGGSASRSPCSSVMSGSQLDGTRSNRRLVRAASRDVASRSPTARTRPLRTVSEAVHSSPKLSQLPLRDRALSASSSIEQRRYRKGRFAQNLARLSRPQSRGGCSAGDQGHKPCRRCEACDKSREMKAASPASASERGKTRGLRGSRPDQKSPASGTADVSRPRLMASINSQRAAVKGMRDRSQLPTRRGASTHSMAGVATRQDNTRSSSVSLVDRGVSPLCFTNTDVPAAEYRANGGKEEHGLGEWGWWKRQAKDKDRATPLCVSPSIRSALLSSFLSSENSSSPLSSARTAPSIDDSPSDCSSLSSPTRGHRSRRRHGLPGWLTGRGHSRRGRSMNARPSSRERLGEVGEATWASDFSAAEQHKTALAFANLLNANAQMCLSLARSAVDQGRNRADLVVGPGSWVVGARPPVRHEMAVQTQPSDSQDQKAPCGSSSSLARQGARQSQTLSSLPTLESIKEALGLWLQAQPLPGEATCGNSGLSNSREAPPRASPRKSLAGAVAEMGVASSGEDGKEDGTHQLESCYSSEHDSPATPEVVSPDEIRSLDAEDSPGLPLTKLQEDVSERRSPQQADQATSLTAEAPQQEEDGCGAGPGLSQWALQGETAERHCSVEESREPGDRDLPVAARGARQSGKSVAAGGGQGIPVAGEAPRLTPCASDSMVVEARSVGIERACSPVNSLPPFRKEQAVSPVHASVSRCVQTACLEGTAASDQEDTLAGCTKGNEKLTVKPSNKHRGTSLLMGTSVQSSRAPGSPVFDAVDVSEAGGPAVGDCRRSCISQSKLPPGSLPEATGLVGLPRGLSPPQRMSAGVQAIPGAGLSPSSCLSRCDAVDRSVGPSSPGSLSSESFRARVVLASITRSSDGGIHSDPMSNHTSPERSPTPGTPSSPRASQAPLSGSIVLRTERGASPVNIPPSPRQRQKDSATSPLTTPRAVWTLHRDSEGNIVSVGSAGSVSSGEVLDTPTCGNVFVAHFVSAGGVLGVQETHASVKEGTIRLFPDNGQPIAERGLTQRVGGDWVPRDHPNRPSVSAGAVGPVSYTRVSQSETTVVRDYQTLKLSTESTGPRISKQRFGRTTGNSGEVLLLLSDGRLTPLREGKTLVQMTKASMEDAAERVKTSPAEGSLFYAAGLPEGGYSMLSPGEVVLPTPRVSAVAPSFHRGTVASPAFTERSASDSLSSGEVQLSPEQPPRPANLLEAVLDLHKPLVGCSRVPDSDPLRDLGHSGTCTARCRSQESPELPLAPISGAAVLSAESREKYRASPGAPVPSSGERSPRSDCDRVSCGTPTAQQCVLCHSLNGYSCRSSPADSPQSRTADRSSAMSPLSHSVERCRSRISDVPLSPGSPRAHLNRETAGQGSSLTHRTVTATKEVATLSPDGSGSAISERWSASSREAEDLRSDDAALPSSSKYLHLCNKCTPSRDAEGGNASNALQLCDGRSPSNRQSRMASPGDTPVVSQRTQAWLMNITPDGEIPGRCVHAPWNSNHVGALLDTPESSDPCTPGSRSLGVNAMPPVPFMLSPTTAEADSSRPAEELPELSRLPTHEPPIVDHFRCSSA